MAGLKIETELRPCIVSGKHKALFHMWSVESNNTWWDNSEGEEMQCANERKTVGIVEYEDGTIHQCYPGCIKFIDGKINEYCFEEIK